MNQTESENKQDKVLRIKFGLRLKITVSIITLVAAVLGTIAVYFIFRESELLRNQIFDSMKREIEHLAGTAQESIGVDELAIISSIKNLEKISYIKYAYVLNRDGQVIQYFHRTKKMNPGEKLDDGLARSFNEGTSETKIIDIEDSEDSSGRIHDFSRPVLNKLDGKPIGMTVIGLSDIIIRKEIANMIRIIGIISLIFLGISIAGSVILAGVIIRPIKKLSTGAIQIGKGDLDYRINLNSGDELGLLAREFNDMTRLIKEGKSKEIEARLMQEQLDMARDIQEGLNPMGYYEKNGVQIKGFTRAAKGVGGDYFDYIDIDENRVGALISDVSGKGVPASLVMVMIRTVFTSYITRGDVDCSSVVTAINDALSADFAIDKFATLFFMIYDRSTRELSFANAGHGPLLTYRAAKHTCTAAKLDGVPIGIMDGVDYEQARVKMEPGDMVLMYTDGITEMRNSEKEEFGIKRVYSLIRKNHNMNAEEFVDKLVDDVENFRGETPPHDDMTVLMLKVTS